MGNSNDKRLFLASFVALITTAFGFIIRAMIMDDWAREFGLTPTQKGEIFGVGLWPFAVSIVLFSLVIDRIGYGRAMLFAFICHVASAVITICSPLVLAGAGASREQLEVGQKAGYWLLYLGNFIVALGNGTVEAVINPVVATMFSQAKTKWLNILHAGWPGGLVLGGLLTIAMGSAFGWEWKVGLLLIPTVIYGFMMLSCRFPPNERVVAGVPYRAMLQEVGILGGLVVAALITFEVTRVLQGLGLLFVGWEATPLLVTPLCAITPFLVARICIILAITAVFGAYVRSLGRPMFLFLLVIMIPLATTELGTDSWITDLMTPAMAKLGLQGGWVLVYTSSIMMILRFFAGPIVHRISPLGLLAVSATIAAIGLVSLSLATGVLILAAATLYGFGKTFFWPTMLGVAAEQFPKGGALTLNTLGGVGMLGVGVVGAALLGNIQDKEIDKDLQVNHPTLRAQVLGESKTSVFGQYSPLDEKKVEALPGQEKAMIEEIQTDAKKNALRTVAIFPVFMLACYIVLILYFRSRGGYKAEVLVGHKAMDEEFTGGVPGPAEL